MRNSATQFGEQRTGCLPQVVQLLKQHRIDIIHFPVKGYRTNVKSVPKALDVSQVNRVYQSYTVVSLIQNHMSEHLTDGKTK